MSQYMPITACFEFFDGVLTYTVFYHYALGKWYIFEGKKQSGAVFTKSETLSKKKINMDAAEDVFVQFLNQ